MAIVGEELKVSKEIERETELKSNQDLRHQDLWKERAKEFKSFMVKINPGRGITNCNFCAIALNDILSNGLPKGGKKAIQPVSTGESDLATDVIFSKSPVTGKPINEILRSFISHKEIEERIKTCIDPISFDVSSDEKEFKEFIVIDKDIPSKKRSIKLKRSSFQNIKKALQDLAIPGRNGIAGKTEFYVQQGAAYGFIILTRPNAEEGHIINWFRDSENQIYFLDAQDNKNPNTFVQEDLPKGYKDEVFYINCTPPEGFHIKVKTPEAEVKEDAKAKKEGNMDMDVSMNISAATAQDLVKIGEGYCTGLVEGKPIRTNFSLAFQLFSDAASLGNLDAKVCMAHYYLHGIDGKNDVPYGMRLLNECVKAGNARAMSVLGYCYENGIGVVKNEVLAFNYYKQATDMGNVKAMLNLGRCYLGGRGVSQDTAQGIALCQKTASMGQIDANYQLALYYKHGYYVTQNPVKAFEYFQKAARLGHSVAKHYLGYCYAAGKGCPKNLTLALQLYTEAAKLNVPGAKKDAERIRALIKESSSSSSPSSSSSSTFASSASAAASSSPSFSSSSSSSSSSALFSPVGDNDIEMHPVPALEAAAPAFLPPPAFVAPATWPMGMQQMMPSFQPPKPPTGMQMGTQQQMVPSFQPPKPPTGMQMGTQQQMVPSIPLHFIPPSTYRSQLGDEVLQPTPVRPNSGLQSGFDNSKKRKKPSPPTFRQNGRDKQEGKERVTKKART